MYQSIIQLDNKLPDEKIQEITKLIDAAFDNRCGKVINSSNNPYILKYEGSKKDYPCMDISQIELITNSPEVLNYIVAWNWVDEIPEENCDMMEIYKKYYGKFK